MKNIFTTIILSMGLIIVAPALASSPTETLANCLVDSLNGKQKKNLAKWVFFAIAAHPEIKSYSSISSKDITESDKYVGKLITRLLTVDCPKQLIIANKSDPLALRKGFELVGKVAMQELMTNQDVTKAITNYIKYADQEKLNKILIEE